MKWVGHIAREGGKVEKVLVGNLEAKGPLGRLSLFIISTNRQQALVNFSLKIRNTRSQRTTRVSMSAVCHGASEV